MHWGPTKAAGWGGKPLVLVGQAPSRRSNPAEPLTGVVAAKICQVAEISMDDYLGIFDRANLLSEWPGPSSSGKGDAFPINDACRAALRLLPDLVGRRVILLGREVARAFRLQKLELLTWVDGRIMRRARRKTSISVLPHPSGVSRWWNEEANRSIASDFLKLELTLIGLRARG